MSHGPGASKGNAKPAPMRTRRQRAVDAEPRCDGSLPGAAGFRSVGIYMRALGAVAAIAAGLLIGVSATPAVATATFGPGNAAWDNYYANPLNTASWSSFCQGGGGSWLQTAIDVPACGPTGSINIVLPGGSYTGGFQCVELSERYLYVSRGWAPISGTNGAMVVAHYAAAHGVGIINDGTSGKAPALSDIIGVAAWVVSIR